MSTTIITDLKNSYEDLLYYDFESIKDPLVKNFLSIKSNEKLLLDAQKEPSEVNILGLNLAFERYYTEIQLIKYISQLINHYSRDFYRKKNREKELYVYAFEDESIFESKEVNEQFLKLGDKDGFFLQTSSILDEVQDQNLHNALNKLTKRQLMILNLHFLHQMSHTEIALHLTISQQSVSKTIKQSLQKIRETIS
ncbi:sigma-70 family RNA polymerase sigma factor [Alkalihalophilus lindianensis]|uniref:Sigma-70 family RNA polymerase sigma factor n=1 Tax=Alkalihalophilus lindianensis TaxID=1630542 RepID=A0ABU3X966_9BACI|nr:sigma-70 family RNA polymerase sigma factor [Alkalihalophilus lindianensis]MDV2684425.1 sigma-70 family RNA polymerase sigma factor [Alkalihalophilus lindianensis]